MSRVVLVVGLFVFLFLLISGLLDRNTEATPLSASRDFITFPATEVDLFALDSYLQKVPPSDRRNIDKVLIERFGESLLRKYIEAPTDPMTAREAAAALALHGLEAESGDAVVAFVKDPRELPRVEDFGTKGKRYGKINMVYLLGRFDSQSVRDFLLRVVNSASIYDELPRWMELANLQGDEPEALIEMAGFQGRAGIALMLTDRPECRDAVERSYRDVLARAKTLASYDPALGVRPTTEQVVMSHLIQEMVSAMGVGDCVKEHGPTVCMEYLSTMEGTFYGLGNYFLARGEEANAALGVEE